jgi:hypothetical protein
MEEQRTMRFALAIGLFLAAPLIAQDGKQKRPQPQAKVDEAKVEAAIRRGIAHLKGQAGNLGKFESEGFGAFPYDEIVLWTMLHGGGPEIRNDPNFQKLLNRMLEAKLERTYNVSLQAMVLDEVDRVKFQRRIWQCAQFLVDNQCKNGQWSYGEPTPFDTDIPSSGPARKEKKTPTPAAKVRKFESGRPQEKPKPVRTLPVTPKREGPSDGDNSNSQYAALGLRACHDAGIVLPKDILKRAEQWWRQAQHQEMGWTYPDKGAGSSGSMTAGAVGSLAIYLHIQGQPWMRDQALVKGLEWLARNFSVTENPGVSKEGQTGRGWKYYYYLYALERSGVLYGTEALGPHEWYPEGAKVLTNIQRADGSWWEGQCDVTDTCFAILFLRRATRPLVESVDRSKRSGK